MVKRASDPHSYLSVERQRGWLPPPHSSLNSILVPSLLNVAECQNDMLGSATSAMRTGFTGSLMSSSKPRPPHAPPARPISEYTVMSWHWFGPRGVGGGPFGVGRPPPRPPAPPRPAAAAAAAAASRSL